MQITSLGRGPCRMLPRSGVVLEKILKQAAPKE